MLSMLGGGLRGMKSVLCRGVGVCVGWGSDEEDA